MFCTILRSNRTMIMAPTNPIEKSWKELDDKEHLHGRFRNTEDLYQELQIAWSQIKQYLIDALRLFRTIDYC